MYTAKKRNALKTQEKVSCKTYSSLLQFLYGLVVEVISFYDMITDFEIIIQLCRSRHIAWMCISLVTFSAPYYLAFAPILTFSIGKVR